MQPTHQTTRSARTLDEPPDTERESGTRHDAAERLSGVDLSAVESPQAKLVCLYLAIARNGTVDDLHDALGMSRLELFTVLGTLAERGHLSRDGQRYELG